MVANNDEVIKGVENPSLVEAIKEHYEKNSEQSTNTLVSELLKATYLTAVMDDNMQIENGTLQVGSTLSLGTITDEEGRTLLPIFTDWIHLNDSVPGKSGFVMNAEWALSSGRDEFDGVVINHTGLALPIYKEFLSKLLSEKNA